MRKCKLIAYSGLPFIEQMLECWYKLNLSLLKVFSKVIIHNTDHFQATTENPESGTTEAYYSSISQKIWFFFMLLVAALLKERCYSYENILSLQRFWNSSLLRFKFALVYKQSFCLTFTLKSMHWIEGEFTKRGHS